MKTYYVYLLTDPRNNNEVFYCGKGTGDRWKSHQGHWSGNGKNNPTENKILKIQKEGLQPGVIFLHKNILDENEAYHLEENYIRENFDKLTNLKIEANPPNRTGKKSGFAGKKHSAASKRKTSNTLTGQKRGRYSDEHKKSISESLSGDKHPMYGKPSPNRKSIIELVNNVVYSDQITAAKALGLKQGDIANCLAGRQKSTKGYRFVFCDK